MASVIELIWSSRRDNWPVGFPPARAGLFESAALVATGLIPLSRFEQQTDLSRWETDGGRARDLT